MYELVICLGFILGFAETIYEMSESSGTVEVCVDVFNPPSGQMLFASVSLLVRSVHGSAGKEVHLDQRI